jgi:hypothetical protein
MDDTIFLIILCYYAQQEQQRKNEIYEVKHRQRRYIANLRRERQRQIQRSAVAQIPRAVLVPWQSPWEKVLLAANESSFITLTGLDCASFRTLHGRFRQCFNGFTPHQGENGKFTLVKRRGLGGASVVRGRGHKRIVTSEACLGLLLVYIRTTVPCHMLSSLFGLTAVSYYIRFATLIVLRLLNHLPTARLVMPTNEKVEEYKQTISAQYPLLSNVYCVCDGLRVSIRGAGQMHITNLFVFVPDGTIIAAALNCPGIMEDSDLAWLGRIYPKLDEVNERVPGGAKCVMDSAFVSFDEPYVIKSTQAPHQAEDDMMAKEATSMRQAAEWGMCALKSSVGRLKGTLPKDQSASILSSMVLLHNWRVNTVGENQIRTVFMPHLTKDADRHLTDQL